MIGYQSRRYAYDKLFCKLPGISCFLVRNFCFLVVVVIYRHRRLFSVTSLYYFRRPEWSSALKIRYPLLSNLSESFLFFTAARNTTFFRSPLCYLMKLRLYAEWLNFKQNYELLVQISPAQERRSALICLTISDS